MKHSRELYEERALLAMESSAELDEMGKPDHSARCVQAALVWATLAAAANDEHTHYYPHKLVEQLPWNEQAKAAREALRGVRKGKTTVTGEKLQHDGSGKSEHECFVVNDAGVDCKFIRGHVGLHSWESAGQRHMPADKQPEPKMCPGGEAVNNHNGDPACPRCGWSQPPPGHAPGVRGQVQFVSLIARAHPDAGRQG